MKSSFFGFLFIILGPLSFGQNLQLIGEINLQDLEASGIVRSPDNRLFVIGDSGNRASVYELNWHGEIISEYPLLDATNVDWEELQFDENNVLYIGDIGNNLGLRQDLTFYVVPDFLKLNSNDTIRDYSQIHYQYGDQLTFTPDNETEFDCEAFIVRNGEINLFSKNHGENGYSKRYKLASNENNQEAILIDSIYTIYEITGSSFLEDELYLLSNNHVQKFSGYHLTDEWEELENLGWNTNLQLEGIHVHHPFEFNLVNDVESGDRLSQLLYYQDSDLSNALISLFPNPANDVLHINSYSKVYDVVVYDFKGIPVFSEHCENSTPALQLDLETLASGVYVIWIYTDQGILKEQFVRIKDEE